MMMQDCKKPLGATSGEIVFTLRVQLNFVLLEDRKLVKWQGLHVNDLYHRLIKK